MDMRDIAEMARQAVMVAIKQDARRIALMSKQQSPMTDVLARVSRWIAEWDAMTPEQQASFETWVHWSDEMEYAEQMYREWVDSLYVVREEVEIA